MTTQELFDLVKDRPFLSCRLVEAPGELECLMNNCRLPPDLQLTIFFGCPFEAFARNPRPKVTILKP